MTGLKPRPTPSSGRSFVRNRAFSSKLGTGLREENAAKPEAGRLRRHDIFAADRLARDHVNKGKPVLIASHHPLKIFPWRAGAEAVGRAGLVIQRFAEPGMTDVLTEHIHCSEIVPVQVGNGTFVSISSDSAKAPASATRRPRLPKLMPRLQTIATCIAPAPDLTARRSSHANAAARFSSSDCLKRENGVWRFFGQQPAA